MECVDCIVQLGAYTTGVMLVSEVDPSASEWAAAIKRVQKLMDRQRLTTEQLRLLTVTQGGAPNSRQRAELKLTFEGHHPKVSVVSAALDNPIKRGIATALQWINPNIALFAPERARAALSHIDVAEHAAQVLEVLRELERQVRPLPIVSTFAAAVSSASPQQLESPRREHG